MAKKWLEKKSIQLCLGMVVVLVWGYNMLRISDISAESDFGSEGEEIVFDQAFFTVPDLRVYTYSADFPDPFRPRLNRQIKKKPAEKKTDAFSQTGSATPVKAGRSYRGYSFNTE